MAKRGSSSLNTTLSETEARNNKFMRRDGRACQFIGPSSSNAARNEWSRISPAAPSYPMSSQRRPNFNAHSIAFRDSTLIGVPPLDTLNSTEQSIITRINNVADDLHNMAPVKNELMGSTVALNRNRGAHQNHLIPTNCRQYQVPMNSYLLHSISPVHALNSTARPIAEQRELQCRREMTSAPRMNVPHRPTTVNHPKTTNIPQEIGLVDKPTQHMDTRCVQRPDRRADDGEIQSHNISVPLFTKPRSQAAQKPSTSNDAAVVFWMDELTKYWGNIENQTKSALKQIKQDRVRRGLLFDAKFKDRFMKSIYEKILGAFEQFLLDERCFDNFYETTVASDDTDHRDHIYPTNHSNSNDIHGIELDDSLICHQVPPVMLSDIQENSHEATIGAACVEIYDDLEEKLHVKDEPAADGMIANAPDTIDLVSDQEEAVDDNANGDSKNDDNLAGQSELTVLRQKAKKKNAKTKRNLKKKSESNGAADTKKQHKCAFCEYSTDYRASLIDHTRTHTNERPFECDFCEKRFAQKANLNSHMKTHGKLFRFQCSNCRQGFPDEKQQKFHEKLCKAKSYECFLCGKKCYQRKNDLLKHMRHKHTGEKPFGCSDCSERFCEKYQLTCHMKRLHKECN